MYYEKKSYFFYKSLENLFTMVHLISRKRHMRHTVDEYRNTRRAIVVAEQYLARARMCAARSFILECFVPMFFLSPVSRRAAGRTPYAEV